MLFIHGIIRYGAYDAGVIADGREVYGNGACLYQGALPGGFVIVPVKKHQVSPSQKGIGTDTVGGGGAAGDKEAFIALPQGSGPLFRFPGHPFVGGRVSDGGGGIGNISTEHALAQGAGKGPAFGGEVKEPASVVAGGIKISPLPLCFCQEGGGQRGEGKGLQFIFFHIGFSL